MIIYKCYKCRVLGDFKDEWEEEMGINKNNSNQNDLLIRSIGYWTSAN